MPITRRGWTEKLVDAMSHDDLRGALEAVRRGAEHDDPYVHALFLTGISRGRLEMGRELIRNGFRVTQEDLSSAIEGKDYAVARFLVENGVRPTADERNALEERVNRPIIEDGRTSGELFELKALMKRIYEQDAGGNADAHDAHVELVA